MFVESDKTKKKVFRPLRVVSREKVNIQGKSVEEGFVQMHLDADF